MAASPSQREGGPSIQRLNKKNISDIFLAPARSNSQPIQLPSLEVQEDLDPVKQTNAPRKKVSVNKIKTSLHKAPNTNSRYIAKNRKFATLASSILTISSIVNPANHYIVDRAAPARPPVREGRPGSVAINLYHTFPGQKPNGDVNGASVARANENSGLTDVAKLKVLSQFRTASNVAGSNPNNVELSGGKKPSKSKKVKNTSLPAQAIWKEESKGAGVVEKKNSYKGKNIPLGYGSATSTKTNTSVNKQPGPAIIKSGSDTGTPFPASAALPRKRVASNNISKLAKVGETNTFSGLSANPSKPTKVVKTTSTVQGGSDNSIKHLRLIENKVFNWRKKKRLLAVLLHKTSDNFANSLIQRRKLFLKDNFSGNINQYFRVEKRLADNLKHKFLNKINKPYRTAWEGGVVQQALQP